MKHCTTDKCPQILDSSCVFYEGASLIFSGINTNDSVETVIQKLNLKLESIPIFNSNNYYDKTEIDILFNNVNLSNYYTKNEADALFTQTYNYIDNSIIDYNNTIQVKFLDYYTKVEINSQFLNYYTKTELDTALATKLDKGTYIGTAQDLKNLIDSKLNKPTTTSNTTSYPYVVGEDGNGNSARLPAGDLGKNFFNSDLSNTTARNHTMNAGVTINTLGNPHTLSGLPNKNTDITNFRKVRVQNTSGLDAVVDSKSMLLDMPSYLTEQERTNWKTAMNGGWTTNTMDVALISPFIIKNDNNVNWILLKGANLNLPPTSFEVAIMNEAGTSVLAIVPNSQVQLYTNGTDLIFYYNFFTLGLGKYKIRLWNGVAYYITNSKLTITDTITNIPFQQGEIRLVSGSSSINVATAYEVILKPDPNIKAQPTEPLNVLSDIVSNWVDGNVLQGNEDWWVQLSVECVVKANWFSRVEIANVGLSSSSSSSSLLSPTVGGILIYNQSTSQDVQNPDIGIIGGDALIKLANSSQINYIKIGSILQTLIVASNGNIVSSITTIDTSQNYRLVSNCNNQPDNNGLNWQAGIKLTKVRISNL